MPCPVDIHDCIISGRTLELEVTTEFVKIELQLPADPGIIRNVIEYMDLVIYVLNIFK